MNERVSVPKSVNGTISIESSKKRAFVVKPALVMAGSALTIWYIDRLTLEFIRLLDRRTVGTDQVAAPIVKI